MTGTRKARVWRLFEKLAELSRGQGDALAGFKQIRTSLPPNLRTVRPNIHPDLEAICFGAMEKRPRERYPSARALAEDLDAFLERRPVSRRTPTLFGRLGRWSQRRPAEVLAAGAFIALGFVGPVAGFLYLKDVQEAHAEGRGLEFAELYSRLPILFTLESDARYVCNRSPLQPRPISTASGRA